MRGIEKFLLGICGLTLIAGLISCNNNDDSSINADSDSLFDTDSDTGSETEIDTAQCVVGKDVNNEYCIAKCEAITDKKSCEFHFPEPAESVDFGHGCIWLRYYETSMDEHGNCSYGKTIERCVYYGSGEGGGAGLFCSDDIYNKDAFDWEPTVDYFEDDGNFFLGLTKNIGVLNSQNVGPCYWARIFDDKGEQYILEGPPECTCPCNEDFPGWVAE